ncbi:MAG: spermidine/putrescine ABC transporter substrate-binding protein [Chromatiales bacterium]|jgi:spermidine/putrescine transport system substrate-binding protein|nr:spermidine/putrescine ABC transporter substrate-binding protein [Chromatiales bacterium]
MSKPLSIVCWEGYDTDAILTPFRSRTGAVTQTQTLVSDAHTAHGIVAGTQRPCDVLNINNAYVRDFLHPRGLVRPLDAERFAQMDGDWLDAAEAFSGWCFDERGQRIGIAQRFGPFNLVVNTRRISRASAEDQGFALADDPGLRGRFGILEYDDFNIFHLCIAADLNPFLPLNARERDAFSAMATRWYANAAIATSGHHALNRALVDGDIDFYLSGGVYTVSPARLCGYHELEAVTPSKGPIDGRGGIAFAEITCLVQPSQAGSEVHPDAEAFIQYLLEPDTAIRAAFVEGTCNPVVQMGNEQVRAAFSKAQLRAIQWDTLVDDLGRCAHYQLVPDHDDLLARLQAVRRLQ